MFKKLKSKLIMKIIKKWIAAMLSKFKAKNPILWGVILAIATTLQFGIPEAGVDPNILSLDWILQLLKVNVSDEITDLIMWFIIAITGSNTAEHLDSEKLNARIDELHEAARAKK